MLMATVDGRFRSAYLQLVGAALVRLDDRAAARTPASRAAQIEPAADRLTLPRRSLHRAAPFQTAT